MLEHLPENFFSEDLIRAHLQSEVGRGELRGRMEEMMEALRRTNPALANSIVGAVSTAPSSDAKFGNKYSSYMEHTGRFIPSVRRRQH